MLFCLDRASGFAVSSPAEPPPESSVRRAALRIQKLFQRFLLPVMLLTYVLAGLAPRLGLAMRHVSLGSIAWFGEAPVTLSLPTLLLSVMLLNAGLGVRTEEFPRMLKQPAMLLAGVIANTVLPLMFILIVAFVAQLWPDDDEVQNLLVGLGLLAAMPVAGGATVWTQNADGNVALSVGLVLVSTALSPFMIPLGLHAVGYLTHGDLSDDLHELARGGSGTFALVSVVIPCLVGIGLRRALGSARVLAAMPYIKLVNLVNILFLSYSNASGAMVEVLRAPDYDLLLIVFLAAAGMAATSFSFGYLLARRLRADDANAVTLTFGTGMNNSSASAVLASTNLTDHPLVLLPILAYSMLQKLMAGSVDATLRRKRANAGRSTGAGRDDRGAERPEASPNP